MPCEDERMSEAYNQGGPRGNFTYALGGEEQPELLFQLRTGGSWVAGTPPSQALDIVFMHPQVRPAVDITSELLRERGISLVYQSLPGGPPWVPHSDRGFPGHVDPLSRRDSPTAWARSRGTTIGHNATASTSLVLPIGSSREYLRFIGDADRIITGHSRVGIDAVRVPGHQPMTVSEFFFTAPAEDSLV